MVFACGKPELLEAATRDVFAMPTRIASRAEAAEVVMVSPYCPSMIMVQQTPNNY